MPATYRLAVMLPGALEHPLEDLDRLLPERFEHDGRDVLVVLNGTDQPSATTATARTDDGEDEKLQIPIYPGGAFVVIDSTPVVTLTPEGGEWFFDPFDGGRFGPDHPIDDAEQYILEALHARLIGLGEELPDDLDAMVAGGDGGDE